MDEKIEKNKEAFEHEAEVAEQIKYGTRTIKQTIHKGQIVGVEELDRKVNWKVTKKDS